MSASFFPGPIDFEAIYGLGLHAERCRAADHRAMARVIRKELERCLAPSMSRAGES